MAWLSAFLESQPLFALFLTIALGYLIGEINLRGFSLGSGAVLFVGLAIGAFAPKAAPPALIGTLGLLLFLYGVGLAYGKQFFTGLVSPNGIKANVAAACGVLAALGTSLLATRVWNVGLGEALGMFAGSGTSTATLQAVIAALKSDGPAVGYSVAYPFGVAGPILFLYAVNALLKPKVEAPAGALIEVLEATLTDAKWVGQPFSTLSRSLPPNVEVVAIRRQHHNIVPSEGLTLRADDCIMLAATDRALLERAAKDVGEISAGRMSSDRANLDYFRVFASKKNVVGMPLGSLQFPFEFDYRLVHVRRGDTDLLPRHELVLEFGDRIGILVPPGKQGQVRKFFGDSIKGTAEFSYISIGVGAAIGLLLGLIPIPIPGVGKLTLGLAAVLLFSLWLGKQRRFLGLTWTMPLSANLVLRNFGLTVFLAQVGMASGPKFAKTVGETGWTFLAIGALILLALVVVTFVVAHVVLRLPFDESAGVVCGATGNPAILAFANRIAPTDKPDVAYAMIFPSMTVLKIVIVEVAAVLLSGAG